VAVEVQLDDTNESDVVHAGFALRVVDSDSYLHPMYAFGGREVGSYVLGLIRAVDGRRRQHFGRVITVSGDGQSDATALIREDKIAGDRGLEPVLL